MSIAKRIEAMSDDAFRAFYDIVLREKKRREVASVDTMPPPAARCQHFLDRGDYFYAYELYAQDNDCSLTLARMVINKGRKK